MIMADVITTIVIILVYICCCFYVLYKGFTEGYEIGFKDGYGLGKDHVKSQEESEEV